MLLKYLTFWGKKRNTLWSVRRAFTLFLCDYKDITFNRSVIFSPMRKMQLCRRMLEKVNEE